MKIEFKKIGIRGKNMGGCKTMEALQIADKKLQNTGIKVSEISKKDFTIGSWKFKWDRYGKKAESLRIMSSELLGEGVAYRVRNATQLIFFLATRNPGTGKFKISIGEDGDEVILLVEWDINNQPKFISDNETEEP